MSQPLTIQSEFARKKARILRLTKGSPINLQVAKDKAKIKGMISTEEDCDKVLAVLEKPRKPVQPVPGWVKDRYNAAHKLWFEREYPQATIDNLYSPPVFPKTSTGNGLNNFIENYLKWMGFRATRVNVVGRMIGGRRITSTTRKGTADVSSTIHGKSYMWETKVKGDRPSEHQLKEQVRERAAGGEYYFVKTAAQFLELFDSIVYG